MPNDSLELVSCPSKGTTAKASSVLNKNSVLYGAQNMLDSSDVTCWNSDGDTNNIKRAKTIIIHFNREVDLSDENAYLNITFQGGFVGMNCSTYVSADGGKSYHCIDVSSSGAEDKIVDAEDCNEAQRFDLRYCNEKHRSCLESVTSLKLTFGESTDFYGRITIYLLEVWGREK